MTVNASVLANKPAPLTSPIEDFAGTIDEVLRLGWSGHLGAAQSIVVTLRETGHASHGERAMCRALLALLSAASWDITSARRYARQAISDSARAEGGLSTVEMRWFRLARALAANASELVGDRTRAQRAAQVRFVVGDVEAQRLIRTRADHDWESAPEALKRFARFVIAVHQRYAARPRPGPLTPTELRILKHIDAGAKAPNVAQRLGLSPHTVRTHLRNAYAKLGAHGREHALNRARALGLLDDVADPRQRAVSGR